MKKNSSIEFYRFLFALIISVSHFVHRCEKSTMKIGGGYLTVEFFFVLSGFFLMHKYYREQEKKTQMGLSVDTKQTKGEEAAEAALGFLKSKLARLYPHYIFSFLVLFAYTAIFVPYEPLLVFAKNAFWEVLMLQDSGISDVIINPPTWYISAMLIACFFAYYLVNRCHKQFSYIIAPLCSIGIFCYIDHVKGDLMTIQGISTFTTNGVLRAFAEICIGCIFYELYYNWKPYFEGRFRLFFTVLEIAVYGTVLYFMFGSAHSTDDFIAVVLMGIVIASTFAGNSYLSKILNHPLSQKLGGLSYAMYLNQWLLIQIFKNSRISQFSFYTQLVLYLVILFVYSILTDEFCNRMAKKISVIWKESKR